MEDYRILTINPGSTSTKIAYFQGEECRFEKNISHEANELAKFEHTHQQLDYRKSLIEDCLDEAGISILDLQAIVGRGGGLLPLEGGVYTVDEKLLHDARTCANGVEHPANLGAQLADLFAHQAHCPAFVVNPPDTDEYQLPARLTGVKSIYRASHLHALNLKETALQHAKKRGEIYEEVNYIVCHIGGGISVSAHRKGKMIDGIDIAGGEGPMAPTRSGSLSLANIIQLLENGASIADLKKFSTRTGGLVSLLGTSDAKSVSDAAQAGDKKAKYAWDTMIYQIAKTIGEMACVLKGDVTAILLGGGMVHNENLVSQLQDYCKWIAPIYPYPGEFEMEAMANGAVRVLNGEEVVKYYTGKPVWNEDELSF